MFVLCCAVCVLPAPPKGPENCKPRSCLDGLARVRRFCCYEQSSEGHQAGAHCVACAASEAKICSAPRRVHGINGIKCCAQVSEEVAALMAEQGITDLEKSGLLYLSNDARARPQSGLLLRTPLPAASMRCRSKCVSMLRLSLWRIWQRVYFAVAGAS